MKNKMNQLFKDKLFLVMLVLGLLTIVAAAGTVKIRKGNGIQEANPYLDMPESGGVLAESEPETKAQAAGNSDASYALNDKKDIPQRNEQINAKENANENVMDHTADHTETANSTAKALTLNFTGTEKLDWPVTGNIILDYNMDSTIYFPTLDQYKCNSAVIIQSDVSEPVNAPVNARIMEIGTNEEIGNYVILDIGNDYTITCGQLKDIQVVKDEYIYQGSLLGYIAEPTKYYSIEGNSLFLEMQHGGIPVDALEYLK
ncbi:MAG: peptidoglycan DD-metalloendopeptidase family protein [Clostridium sp.]